MSFKLTRYAFVLLVISPLALEARFAAANDDVPKSGEKTVGQVCSTCHAIGLMGAPKIGDSSAWQGRLSSAGSIDRLVESAEHGKGNMPPRGGMASLTDADLKAAISYMVTKSGVTLPP